MTRGILALGFAALIVAGMPVATADDVIVDGTEVTAKAADGKTTASISLINVGATPVSLTPTANVGCTVVPTPKMALPGQVTDVSLELLAGCPTEAAVTVDLDGATGSISPVVVNPAEVEDSDWAPMGQGALVGLVMWLVVGTWGAGALWRSSAPSTPAERLASYDKVKQVVGRRMGELEGTPTAPPQPPESSLSWVDLPEVPGYGLGSTVANLEAGWSLKDSWVSNISVAATAFIALATSADLFTAILGEKPDAALGVMTVSGLVAAVVIGVANTLVKVIGPSTKKVTVVGLLLSTTLVVFAAGLQAATVGFAAADALKDTGSLASVALLLMFGVCGAAVVYGGKTLAEAVSAGRADSLPDIKADALEAWAATAPWEKELVEQRIRQTYKTWLKESSQPAIAQGPPAPGPGERWARPRASLL